MKDEADEEKTVKPRPYMEGSQHDATPRSPRLPQAFLQHAVAAAYLRSTQERNASADRSVVERTGPDTAAAPSDSVKRNQS